MIYVNYTGKHIGECLTGFGINAPITIINSGNSDVLYTFADLLSFDALVHSFTANTKSSWNVYTILFNKVTIWQQYLLINCSYL